MTNDEAMRQILDGAPPGTTARAFRDGRLSCTVIEATVHSRVVIELGRIEDSIHHDPLSVSVDWPAVLRTLPEPEAKRGGP